MNIAHNIERACNIFPDKLALKFEKRHYTYRELDEQVNRLSNALQGLGVQRGERIALFLPNIPEFCMAYLAAQKMGAIAVSVSPLLKQEEVAYILQDSGAAAVITTGSLRPLVEDHTLPTLRHIIIAEGDPLDGMDLYDLMDRASPRARALDLHRDDPAAIVYTSGTTGFPKGATLSHGNVISNCFAKIHYCGMTPSDRILLYLPLFHCFGQNAIMNSAITGGATLILQRRFEVDQVLRTIADEGITMFFAVPSIYIRFCTLEPAACDFSSIRYWFSAAATLPEAIARQWFERWGQLIHIGYGLTESSPFASYNHDLDYRFGSIGSPIENVEMKVMGLDGEGEVPPGTPGEIAIRGPNVMLGYWNRPQETAESIRDGWLYSGDIGTMDEDGYFYIVDRRKDMINVSGFKVYPAEVENCLYKHPAVAEAAVYGLPDPVRGERVKARVILRDGHHDVSEETLIDFCRANIATYKAPREVQFVPSIPRNGAGKILKRVIREEELGPSDAPGID